MQAFRKLIGVIVTLAPIWTMASSTSQNLTAEELVLKNIKAKGGLEKIKAIHSLKMSGKFQQGGFTAQVSDEKREPLSLRKTFSVQGMNDIKAYDGHQSWKISPFEGRKTAELIGDDDARTLIEDADFYGPLIDYAKKGHQIQYLGHVSLDGDDALRLKVTLKNGDIFYYYLDPDTFLEIRVEAQIFFRGTLRESTTDLGCYKLVNGVYFPFSVEIRGKQSADESAKITFDKIEANVNLPDSEFKMPAGTSQATKKD